MAKRILKMCIGEKEMEINMDGYSNQSVDAISTFIDHIDEECLKTHTYFNATLYETLQWNDRRDKMYEIKEQVDKYLSDIPCMSSFIINDGVNLQFGIAARLKTAARLDEEAIANMSYNNDGIISHVYYDSIERAHYACFNDGHNISIIPDIVKAIMETCILTGENKGEK